jgi:hypothetical protein
MKVIERMVQEIHVGKFGELAELDERYAALEKPLGYPPLKRYYALVGPHNMMTTVIEREWESMADMEAAREKAMASPELQALHVEGAEIIKSSRLELYVPM